MSKMVERVEMLKAMDLLARSINDESIFEEWLVLGIADGDAQTNESLQYYAENEEVFADIMNEFTSIMKRAHSRGGLYAGGVLSKEGANV